MNELKNYADYKSAVVELISCLQKFSEFNTRLSLEKCNESINDAIARLKADTFNIAIVGEFNRGKSSLINALLGKKNVLPVSIKPTTASINKVIYGLKPYADILYKDGSSENIDLSNGSDILKQYLTKLTDESSAKAEKIKEVLVYYPVDYCRNGVTIIDTPGLNDDAAMTDITLSVLPTADVAIMVLMATAPYSQSENDFLENKILAGDIGKVLFVVNGIDQMHSEEEKQRIIDTIKHRIEIASLKKVKSLYGEESEKFLAYKNKLGNIRVFGISAKKAVKAKEEKNTLLLAESKLPDFEEALERFIVEERGAISLLNPLNKLKTTSVAIMRSCAERQAALKMDLNEFIERCDKAKQEINELKGNQTVELSRISEAAQATYQDLTPEVDTFWTAVMSAIDDTIDTYPISIEDLKKERIDETQKKLITEVQKALEQTAEKKSEYIKECIIQDLQAETNRLSGFEKDFFEGIERIQNCIIPTDTLTTDSDSSDVFTPTVISYFTIAGAGGIYQGFKQAGWKGALVGGIGGFAGSLGIGMLAVSLSVPIVTPVLVIVGILASLTGTFTGKWLLNLFFPSDKIEKFKEAVKVAVEDEVKKLQTENDFSVKVREQIDSLFNALKEKVRRETDTILTDTQNRLLTLEEELTKNKINKETEKKQLEEIAREVSIIDTRVKTIDEQVMQIVDAKYKTEI